LGPVALETPLPTKEKNREGFKKNEKLAAPA
jgi:hypothetical protein